MEEDFFDEESQNHPSSLRCFSSGGVHEDASYLFLRGVCGGVSSDAWVKSPWSAFAELVLCLCSNKKLCVALYFQAVAAVVVVLALSS